MASFTDKDDINGRKCIHVATDAAFFRAPMLTSQIHTQYDTEFCKSTEFQMVSCLKKSKNSLHNNNKATEIDGTMPMPPVSVWDTLWLTEQERDIVTHKKIHNEWLTLDQLSNLYSNSKIEIPLQKLKLY